MTTGCSLKADTAQFLHFYTQYTLNTYNTHLLLFHTLLLTQFGHKNCGQIIMQNCAFKCSLKFIRATTQVWIIHSVCKFQTQLHTLCSQWSKHIFTNSAGQHRQCIWTKKKGGKRGGCLDYFFFLLNKATSISNPYPRPEFAVTSFHLACLLENPLSSLLQERNRAPTSLWQH